MSYQHRIPSRKRPLIQGRTAVYHVISRTTCDQFLFDDREKEVFRSMLWKQAAFHGVEILTYCIMSNHFHLLLRFPHRDDLPDSELLERYSARYSSPNRPFSAPAPDVVKAAFAKNDAHAAVLRSRLKARMGKLPVFMRELKTAFSIWYNHTHQNHGTIWAERYKSLIVEDDPKPLNIVAAYIDLNPVRAKLANDPAEYRWCGYAEATGGSLRAQSGLCSRYAGPNREWNHAIAAYRVLLFGKGRMAKGTLNKDEGRITGTTADVVNARGGQLSPSEALRRRIRYFTDGMALGSQEFLEGFFQRHPEHFGSKRKTGPHRMHGADWGGIHALRQLRNTTE